MAKPNPTPDHAQVLIHDLILAVQSSLDIAEETARKHYSFSVAELEVSASFDFEMTEQDSDIPEDKPQPKRWFSLFGGGTKKEHTRLHDLNEKDSSKLTVRMLFRPGGKHLASGTESSDSAPAEEEATTEPAPAKRK
ncbi:MULTISPECIES: hypothetical protein [unclassified Corallococcus]|uniref:hypothetical protein n=1 Tax=unclassified Corallococcus TaxID=2685029 RepID=UPI001A8F27CD|nr:MULTISPECIES: hypothetical protein [unclassified Corallococcus]MBN9685876.1 hypothetical protein [Corallococcus sp. NCSPR001]WAS82683.1 hypothetical protein O0N60_25550 [Corallococcus sp. NCRR]